MKRLFCIFLISMLFVLCSCSSTVEKVIDSEPLPFDNSFFEIEKKLLGTWEMTFNGNTTRCVFEEDGKGRYIDNSGNVFEFKYRLLSESQIEQTMVTIEGKEDTSIYNFEFKGDKLVFDGFEYTRE